MAKPKTNPARPRRTRAHVIAALSRNYVERFFLEKGHVINRPSEDYGYDLIVVTFDEGGYEENGEIRIQLKASDGLRFIRGGSLLALPVERRHYELWTNEPMPVLLILYDAREARAYWLDVQEYFAADPSRVPKVDARTVTLRVPVANAFGGTTVDYARERKSKVLDRIQGGGPT